MVEAEQVQDGCLQIVKVNAVLSGVVAVVVRATVGGARLDSRTGEEKGHRMRIVIASVTTLANRRAAKFCSPQDQRVLQQAARLHVGDQPGDRLVHLSSYVAVIVFQSAVRVPVALAALHEPDAGLGVAPRHKTLPAKVARLRVVQPVKFFRRLGFVVDVLNLRRGGLHAEGQLERVDARLKFVVLTAFAEVLAIDLRQQIEFAALARERFAVAIDERNLCLVDRRRIGADLDPVIVRRQKRGRPGVHSAVSASRLKGDVAGQVLVFKTKPVVEP